MRSKVWQEQRLIVRSFCSIQLARTKEMKSTFSSHCHDCGAETIPDALFCGDCGVSLQKEQSPIRQANDSKPTNIISLYTKSLKKYADFNGRAGRAEYSTFVLLTFLGAGLVGAAGLVLFDSGVAYLALIYLTLLPFYIPIFAVTVRRLHDLGMHTAWLGVYLLPFINYILVGVLCLNKGQLTANQYGPPHI